MQSIPYGLVLNRPQTSKRTVTDGVSLSICIMWYVTALTSDFTRCFERSSLSPLAVQTTSSPSKRTSNSLRMRLSASSMNSISERNENSLSSSSIPVTRNSVSSDVPMSEE